MEAWVDAPLGLRMRVREAILSDQFDRVREVVRGQPLVRAWNLVDAMTGEELPLPHEDPESLLRIPHPLMLWVLRVMAEAHVMATEDETKNSETAS